MQLVTEALTPGPAFTDAELKSDFFHTTAALTYRLPTQGNFHADLLAGARLWYVNQHIEFTTGTLPGRTIGDDNTWVDPMIGIDTRYDLNNRWSLIGKGILAGANAFRERYASTIESFPPEKSNAGLSNCATTSLMTNIASDSSSFK